MTIQFNWPVSGFDLSDLALTLQIGANLLTSAVPCDDERRRDVDAIEPGRATTYDGTYQLTLHAAGSGIADAEGTPLAADASSSWAMAAGTDVTAAGANSVFRIVCDAAVAGQVDAYVNNTTTTPSSTLPLANVAQWQVFGTGLRATSSSSISRRATRCRQADCSSTAACAANGDSLVIVGTSGADNITVNGNQVEVNGGVPDRLQRRQLLRLRVAPATIRRSPTPRWRSIRTTPFPPARL